ncbi:hypothetical protein PANA5342_1120 [Pantoea ananatis LMG 5342]|nr:hypothetical protein PANA5342_1120 [Pantoea ananatis LMG 5342]
MKNNKPRNPEKMREIHEDNICLKLFLLQLDDYLTNLGAT